ncbi:MAG: hypothetical protein B7Y96_07195 [Comamonadaceae bacterium 32-67-11]|nr:MAG: hypothetical protein B7Y96_07195 [Comamonadaceae bacterium 32-67-11]
MIIEWAGVALILLILVAMSLSIWRIVQGPTGADRIVALDIFLAAAIALCVVASILTARTVYLDVGIGLAIAGFVATVGWALLLDKGSAS